LLQAFAKIPQHFKLFTIFTNEVSGKSVLQHCTPLLSVLNVAMVTLQNLDHTPSHVNTNHFQYGGALTLHLLLLSFDFSSLDGATVDYNRPASSTITNIPYISYYNTKQTRNESDSAGKFATEPGLPRTVQRMRSATTHLSSGDEQQGCRDSCREGRQDGVPLTFLCKES
jgi:hypothetical protein